MSIIKQICYNPDTGRLVLSDSENNHFLCDIYGNKRKHFILGVTGVQNHKGRKSLMPLQIPSTNSASNSITSNSIEYLPITRKFEGYSKFPRPLAPAFANIPNYEIVDKGKKELIEQLQKYFSCKNAAHFFDVSNENKALDFLTCDLNDFDSVEKDGVALLQLIENTFEEYKKQYKYKVNLLWKNPIVRALKNFKEVLQKNTNMKIINGRNLKMPDAKIKENYNLLYDIIHKKGLKKKIRNRPKIFMNHNEKESNKFDERLYLTKSTDSILDFTNKKLEFGNFLYEKINLWGEEEEEEEEEKKQPEEVKQQSEEIKPESGEVVEGESGEQIDSGEKLEKSKSLTNDKSKASIMSKSKEGDKEEEVEKSFISILTENDMKYRDENIIPIKSINIITEKCDKEEKFLPGYIPEVEKERGIIRKTQMPKLKDNGELFRENLRILKLSNPHAFALQEKRDEYDLIQLKKKKQQSLINQQNAGFGGFIQKKEED